MTPDHFTHVLAQEGFAEPVRVEREPHGFWDNHTHPFEAKALVLAGDIRIVTATSERVYRQGEVFHLQANEPHSEFYGPMGVCYLVGRKPVP